MRPEARGSPPRTAHPGLIRDLVVTGHVDERKMMTFCMKNVKRLRASQPHLRPAKRESLHETVFISSEMGSVYDDPFW